MDWKMNDSENRPNQRRVSDCSGETIDRGHRSKASGDCSCTQDGEHVTVKNAAELGVRIGVSIESNEHDILHLYKPRNRLRGVYRVIPPGNKGWY